MTNDLNDQVNDQILLLSQYYPDIYTQLEPAEQGSDMKPRRRRKKSKAEGSSSGFRKRRLSEEQVKMLELSFGNERKLESERKDRLAAQLGLDPRQVAVWFQNRRARWRSKKLEEEYSKLKSEHESTIIEICQLETEVLELKERVSKADKEVQKILERSEGGTINSPSSSFSMEVINLPFIGEFGMEGLENVCYMHENDYGNQELEYWANLYDI